jgi:hypothetical protein
VKSVVKYLLKSATSRRENRKTLRAASRHQRDGFFLFPCRSFLCHWLFPATPRTGNFVGNPWFFMGKINVKINVAFPLHCGNMQPVRRSRACSLTFCRARARDFPGACGRGCVALLWVASPNLNPNLNLNLLFCIEVRIRSRQTLHQRFQVLLRSETLLLQRSLAPISTY